MSTPPIGPTATSPVGGSPRLDALTGALRRITYEVLPLRGAEDDVSAHVPGDVALTVTTTSSRGLDATLDLTTRLAHRGYGVKPHIPARLVRDATHLRDVVAMLRDADVTGVVVVAGDAPEAVGSFSDAVSLLEQFEAMGHPFAYVGIAGYPEGHARIPRNAIDAAMTCKAPHATEIITQMCFDAAATVRWARQLKSDGLALPIKVGVPGAVTRRRLARISAGLGLGQSARFLEKQQSLLWRFLLPHGYSPERLVGRVGRTIADADQHIDGFHLFTFNEVERTERWRQRCFERLAERCGAASER